MGRALAWVLVAALLPAGAAYSADCAPIAREEVLAAELQRYNAQTGDDFAALERILGDDLVYIHSSSLVDGKASYVESMRSGNVKYIEMRLEDHQVRVYDCLAIMTGTASFDVRVKENEITVKLRFTEAWAKRQGRLEFVSWQATRIP